MVGSEKVTKFVTDGNHFLRVDNCPSFAFVILHSTGTGQSLQSTTFYIIHYNADVVGIRSDGCIDEFCARVISIRALIRLLNKSLVLHDGEAHP